MLKIISLKLLSNILWETLACTIRHGKAIEVTRMGKEETAPSLLADKIFVYVNNSNRTTDILKLKSEFSKCVRYSINRKY